MAINLNGQYLPQVTHFMYDQIRTNPGSAGSLDMINASIIYRNQWTGFPGAPSTPIVEAEAPFKLFGVQHGVGINLYNDMLGFNSLIDFQLNYAYRITLGNGTLGIGIKGGFEQNTLKPDWHPSEANSDPNIPQSSPDKMTFTLGAGIFYRTDDIYFGASALNINSPQVSTYSQIGTARYNLDRQFYVTAGYTMQLTNPAYEIIPSVLLKSDIVSTDADINLTLMYNKKIWGGVTYRTGEAVAGMIGMELIEGLKIGYAYDFATSAIQKESRGGHEVFINYSVKLGVEKAPEKYKSIRFL